MNLAVSSLIIFILLSPAIISRRLYFTKELSKSFTYRNTIQEIFSSILLSFLIHYLMVCMVKSLNFKVDFVIIIKLLLSPQSITNYSSITDNIDKVFFYFFTSTLLSCAISYIVRNVIRFYKIDRKSKTLRYDNNWYYIFSGEVLDIKQYNKSLEITSSNVKQRVVDVLTKVGDNYTLYRGNLIDFQLNSSNSVDYVVLSSPSKRLITDKFFRDINSNYFIIPYTEVLNINIRYFEVGEDG